MPVPSDIDELYALNVLVMVETAPQSDKYLQIRLDKEAYYELLLFLEDYANVERDIIEVPVTDNEILIPNRHPFCLDNCTDKE